MLGKYRLQRVIGRGATSTVYFAEDGFHQRDVAVKVIETNAADEAVSKLADAGLRTEAALLGKLNHPHIVKIFDVINTGDERYVVMEYVSGGTMEKHCTRGWLLDFEAVVDTIFKCGKALEYMNHLGLIHRDIKPANLLLTEAADVRLTDLGATLRYTLGGSSDAGVGTPMYMSPEQMLEHPLEFRSDMFSLGIVFYELLTGEKPFAGFSIDTLMLQILSHTPTAPSTIRPTIPRELDGIVQRMLAKMPSERYASWQECLDELTAVRPSAMRNVARVANLSSASERFQLMRECTFFNHFSDADLWYVLEIAMFSQVFEGDVLIREGDPGGFFLVLLTGQVRISKNGRVIDLITGGMSMGEISYVLEGRAPRNTTCTAITDGITLHIDDKVLRAASETCRSRFEKTFLQTMASWLADADKRLNAMP